MASEGGARPPWRAGPSPRSGPNAVSGPARPEVALHLLVVAAACVAYSNTFGVPLLLDDASAITQNPSIRHLWPLSSVFRAPDFSGTSGRPLLNFSFALNYALSGEHVWSYHAVNLGLLALSGLALMGIVRRTLLTPRFGDRYASSADWLAATIALVWTVHPLLTESVTYISQRAETLAGLFYLLTLYGLVGGARPPGALGIVRVLGPNAVGGQARPAVALHLFASVVCCWLGIATKEITATAPLVVFIYDAIFIAGSASAAWRARRGYYCALASSWLLLAVLMLSLGKHSVGYHQGVGAFEYLLTECQAIVRYLRLAIWPAPLVFDYGPQLVSHPAAVLPEATLILALLGLTGFLLRRSPAAAFLGVWFFVILAPTSSFVPVALQPIAENRMFLPLAAVVCGVVLAAHRWLSRFTGWPFGVIALGLLVATFERNRTYATARSIWADTAAKRPHNPRALDDYGNTLLSAGEFPAAIRAYRAGLALTPRVGRLHYNLGKALHASGDQAGALAEYAAAIELEPGFPDAHVNLAMALAEAGRPAEAQAQLNQALQLNSNDAASHYDLGLMLFRSGRFAEAFDHYQRSLALDPGSAPVRDASATTLFRLHRPEESVRAYEQLLRDEPRYAPAENNLANVLLSLGQPETARAHLQRALRLDPRYAQAHTNLGLLELQLGRVDVAQREFEAAIELAPQDAEAHFQLGNVMGMKNDLPAAMAQWTEALRMRPHDAAAENNLGLALAQVGKRQEAMAHLEAALRIDPNYDRARANLDELRAK